MKNCPKYGSILADDEPYCENRGFDSDFDFRDWIYDYCSNFAYVHC